MTSTDLDNPRNCIMSMLQQAEYPKGGIWSRSDRAIPSCYTFGSSSLGGDGCTVCAFGVLTLTTGL